MALTKKIVDFWKRPDKIGFMNALHEYQEATGLTISEIARRCGMPISTVWRHMRGNGGSSRKIGAQSALRYSRYLGIKLEKLIQ